MVFLPTLCISHHENQMGQKYTHDMIYEQVAIQLFYLKTGQIRSVPIYFSRFSIVKQNKRQNRQLLFK